MQENTFIEKIHNTSSSFAENQFLTAGIGLVGIGTGMAIVRHSLIKGFHFLSTHFITSLEITSKDPAYRWVLDWLGTNCKSTSRNFTLNTSLNGNDSISFQFSPSLGNHFIKLNNKWVKLIRNRQNSMIDLASGQPFESIVLSTVGREKTNFLRNLLNDSQQSATNSLKDKVAIYTSFGSEWRLFGNPKPSRPLKSVVLQNDISESILEDIVEFTKSADWYCQRGIPFRRAYLLHGPPGTGKSSFVHALASHLGLSIAIINFSQNIFGEDRIAFLLNNLPNKTVLLMEDIDRIFHPNQSSISPSGLLNALDGVASSEGRIIFMTTNHLEKLDDALIRPGRIDIKKYIGNATSQQAKEMFERFFPGYDKLSNEFYSIITGMNVEISPATIQGHLILYKSRPKDAVQSFKDLYGRVMISDVEY